MGDNSSAWWSNFNKENRCSAEPSPGIFLPACAAKNAVRPAISLRWANKTGSYVVPVPRSILNQFLFPAPRPSYNWASFPGELVCLVGRQGNIVPCTIMPGFGVSTEAARETGELDQASVLVIYCHANGEDIGVLNEAGHWLSDTLGVHVLIPEYPGYGVAPGRYPPNLIPRASRSRQCSRAGPWQYPLMPLCRHTQNEVALWGDPSV